MASYDIFLSHASEDKDWVQKLEAELSAFGLTVFLDTKDILPTDNWVQIISEAIRESTILVLILSQYSISKTWVIQEWTAHMASHGPIGRLLPIWLDDTPLPAILASTQALDCRDRDICKATQVISRVMARYKNKSLGAAATAASAVPPKSVTIPPSMDIQSQIAVLRAEKKLLQELLDKLIAQPNQTTIIQGSVAQMNVSSTVTNTFVGRLDEMAKIIDAEPDETFEKHNMHKSKIREHFEQIRKYIIEGAFKEAGKELMTFSLDKLGSAIPHLLPLLTRFLQDFNNANPAQFC